MSFTQMRAEAIRGETIAALKQDDEHELSEMLIRRWLARRVDKLERDELRPHLEWLMRNGLVTINRAEPDLWMVKLTEAGEAVARGKLHAGIARPDVL